MTFSFPRRSALLTLAGAVFMAAVPLASIVSAAPGARAKLVRDAKDPRWAHGSVPVNAPADRVMARVARVDDWAKLFSDIKTLKVLEHKGGYWRVELDTRTMDCGAHEYQVNVAPNGSVKLVIDAPGINAHGLVRTERGGSDSDSIARFALYIESTGVLGWFIPEKTLRARQEQMVRRNLEDLAKAFAKR